MSSTSRSLQSGLESNVPAATFAQVEIAPNEDRALENCESFLIEVWKSASGDADVKRASLLSSTAEELDRFLERQVLFEELIEELEPWLDARSFAKGDKLKESGADELQILLEGRASAYDSAGTRLCQCGTGDPVSPAQRVDARAVSIVADESGRTLVLGQEIRRWLEEHETALAMKLYRYLLAPHYSRHPPAEA